MKKVLYLLLLAAELFAGFIMMGLVYSNIGWFAAAVTTAITAALLIPLLRRLKKDLEPKEKRKTLRRIALVLLIPALVGFLLAVYVLVGLMLYFGW